MLGLILTLASFWEEIECDSSKFLSQARYFCPPARQNRLEGDFDLFYLYYAYEC